MTKVSKNIFAAHIVDASSVSFAALPCKPSQSLHCISSSSAKRFAGLPSEFYVGLSQATHPSPRRGTPHPSALSGSHLPQGEGFCGPAGVRPLRTTIFSCSKIVTPQYAAVKGRCIAAAAWQLDERRGRQYLPLPREQKSCSFLRTGVVPRRGQTLCPPFGVLFLLPLLFAQAKRNGA